MAPDKSCPTGKTRYRDVRHAETQLDRILDDPEPRMYRPTGYLWCTRCRGFHLTSSFQKPRRGSRGPHRRVRSR